MKRNIAFAALALAVAFSAAGAFAPVPDTHWKGKKVAFLGDSITDPKQPNRIYWQFLEERLGLKPLVYAVSGYRWHQMLPMAEKLKKDTGGDVDAILIYVGTNDFNGDVPPGEWWNVAAEEVNRKGVMVRVHRRNFIYTMDTVRGRINTVMRYIKANFPDSSVILMTPLHRGFAKFSDKNVQPDETCANALGLWIDDYARIIREAGDIWSVPVIDLFAEAQLCPNEPAHAKLFRFKDGNDYLHPNTDGHERLAEVMLRRMLALPSSFR